MYTFNNDNIITGYIKQLLHSFNLPRCKVFKTELEAKNYFSESFDGICIIKEDSNQESIIAHISNGEIVIKQPYIFGNYYRNITETLSIYNNVYDYNTHIYLGEYLRFIRDFTGLNLMSLYNCYSGQVFIDNGFKYLIIPVKYNKVYTFAYSGKNYSYLFTNKTFENEIIDEFDNPDQTITDIKVSQFKNINYITSEDKKDNNEANYKLVVRVLEESLDNIVILEGQFNNKEYINYQFNFDNKDKNINYNKVDLNTLLCNVGLLRDNINFSKVAIAFSDRLIEYLTYMTIIPDDPISKNIIDAKYKVYERYGNNPDPETGENKRAHTRGKLGRLNASFDNNLRLRFVDALNQTKLIYKDTKDILGYVDKEIEQVIDDETRDLVEVE